MLGLVIGTAALGASTASAAGITPPRPPSPASSSCTDYVINGFGDCKGFISNCGGTVSGVYHGGVFPNIEYTCHEGTAA